LGRGPKGDDGQNKIAEAATKNPVRTAPSTSLTRDRGSGRPRVLRTQKKLKRGYQPGQMILCGIRAYDLLIKEILTDQGLRHFIRFLRSFVVAATRNGETPSYTHERMKRMNAVTGSKTWVSGFVRQTHELRI
jgi:hypothetical protein